MIFCVGSVNIDQVCLIGKGGIGESKPIIKYERLIGGKGVNQAEAVRRAGCSSHLRFFGKVGCDSGWIMSQLLQNSFPIEYISVEKNLYTGHVIINNYAYDTPSSMFYYPGANSCISLEELEEFLSTAESTDILLAQNEISNTAGLLRLARSKNMQICFNPSPGISSDWIASDYSCTWLILNEHEFNHLISLFSIEHNGQIENGMKQLKQVTMCKYLICTFGANGAVGLDFEEEIHFIKAPKVAIVDTVGAGDCFAGYFVACTFQSYPFKEALKFAVQAASIKVGRSGAFNGIPTMDQVKEQFF